MCPAPANTSIRRRPVEAGRKAPSRREGAIDQPTSASERLQRAVTRLALERPDLSASYPPSTGQKLALCLLGLCITALLIWRGREAAAWLMAPLMIPFACVTALRLLSLYRLTPGTRPAPATTPAQHPRTAARLPDRDLPRYTVMVPLFREAEVVGDLVQALDALAYPADRLEIFLIVEADDRETEIALAATPLPPPARLIRIPAGAPRTKPRALTYALTFATGDLVVVYDAEDLPAPDQLRDAAERFAAEPDLACLQARLDILNAHESWITGQFAIEYAVLFEALLPTLEATGTPIPLGGTSNHFRRTILEHTCAWDPFNVTEDADLGIRLARQGYRVGMLNSTTLEEAPHTLRQWKSQRTRWIKGWIQTYLVHMRHPAKAARDLGMARFFGLHVLLFAQVVTPFANLGALLLLPVHWSWYMTTDAPGTLATSLFCLGCFNLALGYGSVIVLGYAIMRRRDDAFLARRALHMPVYWCLTTWAAMAALAEFWTRPFHWRKTHHRTRAAITRPCPQFRRRIDEPQQAKD